MSKTILITGSTDGIGLATARTLVRLGHRVLLHGRSEKKLVAARQLILEEFPQASLESYRADLSELAQVAAMAEQVKAKHAYLNAVVNNAGVYNVPDSVSKEALDVRFAVNAIAPYLLMRRLQPLLGASSRVINLSSAAQASLEASELTKPSTLEDGAVYAKSKLALTMWTRHVADTSGTDFPVLIAVNPGSLLGSKMVKEAFGIPGGDIQKGADILVRAALAAEFATRSGEYFDNDSGNFAPPHADALNGPKNAEIVRVLDELIASL